MSGHSLNSINNSFTGHLINFLGNGNTCMINPERKQKQVFEEEFDGGRIMIELW